MVKESMPLISLIFPAKNEGDYVRSTIESALKVKTNYPIEIIVVDDGSIDGSCDFITSFQHDNNTRIELIRTDGIGLARAKNLGAEYSKGEYMIFGDAHLIFEDFWIDLLIEPIRSKQADGTTPGIAPTTTPNVAGYGQTLNRELGIQWNARKESLFETAILPGGCFAVSRNVFFDIGGFDNSFKVWGYEDVDFSLKMWLFGYRCLAQPKVKVLHLFRQNFPYQVSWEDTYYNMLRMAYSHFNEGRIEKTKKLINNSETVYIEALVIQSGVLEQRTANFARRKYEDDWFMGKFAIPF